MVDETTDAGECVKRNPASEKVEPQSANYGIECTLLKWVARGHEPASGLELLGSFSGHDVSLR